MKSSGYLVTTAYKTIKEKKGGNWSNLNEKEICINEITFQRIKIGSLELLVNTDSIEVYNKIEEECLSAVIDIPYDLFDFNSNNEFYNKQREILIKNFQYFRLAEIITDRTEAIWIEVPDKLVKGIVFSTCRKNPNDYMP